MLWKLRDEDEAEPALASTPRNASHLLEERFHLGNTLAGQELVRLLNHNHHRRGRAPGALGGLIGNFLLLLNAPQQAGNHEIVNGGRIGVAQVDNRGLAGHGEGGEIHGWRFGVIEDVGARQPVEFAHKCTPANRVICLHLVHALIEAPPVVALTEDAIEGFKARAIEPRAHRLRHIKQHGKGHARVARGILIKVKHAALVVGIVTTREDAHVAQNQLGGIIGLEVAVFLRLAERHDFGGSIGRDA